MTSHRAVGAATVSALVAVTLALLAPLATIAGGPAAAEQREEGITHTSWSTWCLTSPNGTMLGWRGPTLGFASTAPLGIVHGEPFEVVLAPLDQTFATRVPPWVQAPARPWHDVSHRYQLPRDVELDGATVVPGTGEGIEGEPTVVVQDHDGVTQVVVTVPTVPVDATDPAGTISFRAPALALTLRSTGPMGSVVAPTLPEGMGPRALTWREPVEEPWLAGEPDEYRHSCEAHADEPGADRAALVEVPVVDGPVDVAATTELEVAVLGDAHRGVGARLTARTDAVGGVIRFWDDDVLLGEEPADAWGGAAIDVTLPRPGERSLRAELHGAPGYAVSSSLPVLVAVSVDAATDADLSHLWGVTSGVTTSVTASVRVVGLPDEAVGDAELLLDGLPVAVVSLDGQNPTEVPLAIWGTGPHEVEVRYPGLPGQLPSNYDLPVIVRPAPFAPDDVGPDHRFAEEIGWLTGEGIAGGYADGSFGPEVVVTRQTIAAFLHRLLDQPQPGRACAAAPFLDVAAGHPFCPDIAWSVAEGLVHGYGDGGFGPGQPVSRQAFAAMLHRAAGSPETACEVAPFSDVSVGHPFCDEVAWLASEGFATGYPDGRFHPADPLTRGAAAAILARWAS